MSPDDTIVAISTPLGESGIGIVRLSGTTAVAIAEALFRSPRGHTLREMKSHTINYGFIINPETMQHVDEVLVTVMRAPMTYTREDVVEINCHGGGIPLRQILKLLLSCGARLAEPGEFTKRAFLNGRIDLSQAEAVLDVIRSKTEYAEKLALQQLEGRLSIKIHALRERLTEACMLIEAYIDFPDDDVEIIDKDKMLHALESIKKELRELSAGYEEGKLYREGVATAIVGKPNVGKSSLLNALIQRDRAIVTEIPGTTRDVIEEYLNINGLPLRIMDTAGIRHAHDIAEKEGVKRSLMAIDNADLVIAVLDASKPLDEADSALVQRVSSKKTLYVVNKIDIENNEFSLVGAGIKGQEAGREADTNTVIMVSALRGDGIEDLKKAIFSCCISSRGAYDAETILITNLRHKQSIDQSAISLHEAAGLLSGGEHYEVVALYVREALDHLGEIIGLVTTDDILNRIFSTFCIGK